MHDDVRPPHERLRRVLSSSDEEDVDFILLELACRAKSCFEKRLFNGRMLQRLKVDVIVGGLRRTAPTTIQCVSGQL